MITNDAELTLVRSQLTLMENNLQSLRQQIDPARNRRNYFLYAQGLFDMIRSLRSEIDAYLLMDQEQIEVGGVLTDISENVTVALLRDRDDGKPDAICTFSNLDPVKLAEGTRVVVRGAVRHSPTLLVESVEPIAAEHAAAR
jgi:hypothetical protein